MEAMEKLKEGQKFSDVAAKYSEDKARHGVRDDTYYIYINCVQHCIFNIVY